MRSRCRRLTDPAFSRYGGRGIKVCARWDSFENFLADMGERPAGLTLDRKNNDGDYDPSNCRWATRTQQIENKRRTRWGTIGGVEKTYAEWSREYNLGLSTLDYRLSLGWSLERALTTPKRPYCRS